MICASLLIWCLLSALSAASSAPAQDESAAAWDAPGALRAEDIDREPGRAHSVRGEFLVGLHDWSDRHLVQHTLKARGCRVIGAIPRLASLRVRAAAGLRITADEVASWADVRYVEPHGVGGLGGGLGDGANPPDDTHFPSQWNLENTGQSGGTPGADIRARAAWGIQPGRGDVIVAVLDTGIDAGHPEFAGRLLPGYDFVNEDNDPSSLFTLQDPTGGEVVVNIFPHGTFVTGILAAGADNAFGIAGANPRCKILTLQVKEGPGPGAVFDLAQALDRAAEDGVDVVSMSLVDYPPSQLLQDALQRARDADAILVACAGNGGAGHADVTWPGASPLTIAVGMTDHDDQHAPVSGTGDALDFVAPGRLVPTIHGEHIDETVAFTGCSAATPQVAAVAALLRAENPDISHDEVAAFLRAGAADQVGDPTEDTTGWDPFHGHGRIDAYATLSAFCSCRQWQPLKASPPGTSAQAGPGQRLTLDAGPEHAGRPWRVLGSAAGTTPATAYGPFALPLVADRYLQFTLGAPGNGLLQPAQGVLDENGRASAYVIADDLPEHLVGKQLHHAFVVYDGAPEPGHAVFVSNAAQVLLGK